MASGPGLSNLSSKIINELMRNTENLLLLPEEPREPSRWLSEGGGAEHEERGVGRGSARGSRSQGP